MTKIENFLSKIGFTKKEERSAILRILELSGNLEKETFFKDLEILKFHFQSDTVRRFPDLTTLSQNYPSSKVDLENFFEDSSFSEENIRDYLIFTTQKLFGRKVGQERNEITKQEWLEQNSEQIYEVLQNLDMTQDDKSLFDRADYAFVFGAAFARIHKRCESLIKEIKENNLEINGNKIFLVCGLREVPFEFNEESKQYSVKKSSVDYSSVSGNSDYESLLAEFEKSDLFQRYAQESSSDSSKKMLGEQIIGEFICAKIFEIYNIEINLLKDSEKSADHHRSDTKTNSHRIFNKIFSDLESEPKSADTSDLKRVLFVFNNPHSKRMFIDASNILATDFTESSLSIEMSYMGEGISSSSMMAISEIPSLFGNLLKQSLIRSGDFEPQKLNEEYQKITADLQFSKREELLKKYQNHKLLESTTTSPQPLGVEPAIVTNLGQGQS